MWVAPQKTGRDKQTGKGTRSEETGWWVLREAKGGTGHGAGLIYRVITREAGSEICTDGI